MRISTFNFNPFETNCYLVSSSGRAAIIDPSCREAHEIQAVLDAVHDNEVSVERILLTHAHIDHIFGCRVLSREFDVGIEVHADEVPLLENWRMQAAMFGIEIDEPPEPSGLLEPGTKIRLGEDELEILHTPGHSPGSVTFYHAASNVVISGDVLFQGSIGRTDLWKGSMPVLMESIFQVLVPLGEETRVMPGHGPQTTIGKELTGNPFLVDGR